MSETFEKKKYERSIPVVFVVSNEMHKETKRTTYSANRVK